MFECLRNNAPDIDRIISNDASQAKYVLVPIGIPVVTAAANTRKKLGKTLKAVFVTTPNLWRDKPEYQGYERQLMATKADVAMLPLDTEWDAYWKHPPTATSNSHLFEVLREWENNGLAASKRFGTGPKDEKWLFWHEWAVHGGHIVFVPGSTTVDHVQTFFEDILNMA
jgi:hypothetical protein